ncbi:MAG: endonuclease III [Clostridia bacterium]|nr:endonuclease III [Clostridia bacterium]
MKKATNKKERTAFAVAALKERYPDAACSLDYADAFHLLVATRLSAQCTDARVNLVTPALFAAYPDARAMAAADVKDVERLIASCGLFHTKARDIVAMSGQLVERYGGNVPGTMEELLSLQGVGRKTANLILGDVFGQPAVVTDTHFIRIMNRLGLTKTKDPRGVEKDLLPLIPPEESASFCHRVVMFGREVCTARSPKCDGCPLSAVCPSAAVNGR